MRAMRTYAKKNECMNAPVGPFTTFSHCAYGCNIRNELISAAKNTEHQYQYDELDSLASDGGVAYAYDAAGNRTTKTENGETITYTLGLSDGLASWMSMGSPWMFGQSRDRAWEGKREDGEEDTGADPFAPSDIRFTKAIRPRLKTSIPACENCLKLFSDNLTNRPIPVKTPEYIFVPISQFEDNE